MKKLGCFFAIVLMLLFLGCVEEEEQLIQNITNQTNGLENLESNQTINNTNENDINESVSLGNITTNTTVIIENNITNNSIENITENVEEIKNKTLEGLLFGNEKYILVLDDLSLDKPESCAIVSIYEKDTQERLEQAKICPGEEYYWTTPEGKTYRIVVIETAPGYTQGATWARIIIYG